MPRSASATIQSVILGDHAEVDLWTFALPGGTQRWTNGPADISIGGTTWSAAAPVIVPGNVRPTSGVETATLDVELQGAFTISAVTIAALAATGSFDDVLVTFERLYLPTPGTTPTVDHKLIVFRGYVAGVEPQSTKVRLTVKSILARASEQLPRRLAGPMCPWVWGGPDGRCGINRASYTSTDTVAGGSTAQNVVLATGTSGNILVGALVTFASGEERSISAWNAGTKTMTVDSPLAAIPSGSVTIKRGCDKTKATCSTTYSNLARFGGFPAIPTKS